MLNCWVLILLPFVTVVSLQEQINVWPHCPLIKFLPQNLRNKDNNHLVTHCASLPYCPSSISLTQFPASLYIRSYDFIISNLQLP